MKMKKILLNVAFLGIAALMGGCSDFFEVDTDNTLDEKDYITEESEAYTGFMGIISKMQAVGDKIIYLNELRGEMVEPTNSSPRELISIYNYDNDLTGNTYADPAGYYEIVNACNDYLSKLKAYNDNYRMDQTYYKGLISSTLRIKTWTFMTIAKTYGEVVWVDKPMNSLRDLSKFKTLNLDEAMAACKNLLDIGYDDVDGSYEIDWQKWLDHTTAGKPESPYRQWDKMTPPAYILYAEIYLWLGQYQRTINVLQDYMNNLLYTSRSNKNYIRGPWLLGKFGSFWNESGTEFYSEAVSAIMYNDLMPSTDGWINSQSNSLLKHFDNDYPNKYWLAPSESGMNHFMDTEFAPLGTLERDWRTSGTYKKKNDNYVICKFRQSDSKPAYEDNVLVYMYRGADIYFMLAEAFNQLGKTEAVNAMINVGIEAYKYEFDVNEDGVYSGTWNGFLPNWTSNKCTYLANGNVEENSKGYDVADNGLRAASVKSTGAYSFTSDAKTNDEMILKEMMLEMSCEGKVYPAMIRMARRYKDPSIMAKYIGEKYEGKGNADAIRTKIMNGDYFIHWDLGTEEK